MSEWKRRLAGFTGLYVVLSMWTPVLWFISWARETFDQHTYELFDLPPYAIVIGLFIHGCAFAATMGLCFAIDWPENRNG